MEHGRWPCMQAGSLRTPLPLLLPRTAPSRGCPSHLLGAPKQPHACLCLAGQRTRIQQALAHQLGTEMALALGSPAFCRRHMTKSGTRSSRFEACRARRRSLGEIRVGEIYTAADSVQSRAHTIIEV